MREILEAVKEKKDEALLSYTRQFDGADLTPETMRVTGEEFEEACRRMELKLIEVIQKAGKNIQAFHEKQRKTAGLLPTKRELFWGRRFLPYPV